jgi:molybdopterin converting factor subunit 1
MIIAIRMFARAKDLAQTDVVCLEMASGTTVAQLRSRVASVVPALAGILDRCAFAVNNEFADSATVVGETDEVALLPPVSGGAW